MPALDSGNCGHDLANTVIHLFQPDSLESREHLVMFQSITFQGQTGLSQELNSGPLSPAAASSVGGSLISSVRIPGGGARSSKSNG